MNKAQEYIKKDISSYAAKNLLSVPDAVSKLIGLLSDVQLDQLKSLPDITKAWSALQFLEGTHLVYDHINDEDTIYNTDMYELGITNTEYGIVLQYRNSCGINPTMPIGMTKCPYMFHGTDFCVQSVTLENFDTSDIVNMDSMFIGVKFPDNFNFGDKFNTANVTSMREMFVHCSNIPALNFDTSNVTDMYGMFRSSTLSNRFTFGPKFNTVNVLNMSSMFSGTINCGIEVSFDTSNVKDMSCMFINASLHSDIDLVTGELPVLKLTGKFNTSSVTNMSGMFAHVNIRSGVSLGDNFDTSRVVTMAQMFDHSQISCDFSLGDKFNTSNVLDMSYMFNKVQLDSLNTKAKFSLGKQFFTNKVVSYGGMFTDIQSLDNNSIEGLFDVGPNFTIHQDCSNNNTFMDLLTPGIDVEYVPSEDLFDAILTKYNIKINPCDVAFIEYAVFREIPDAIANNEPAYEFQSIFDSSEYSVYPKGTKVSFDISTIDTISLATHTDNYTVQYEQRDLIYYDIKDISSFTKLEFQLIDGVYVNSINGNMLLITDNKELAFS